MKKFLPKFKRDNENELDNKDIIPFASISRRTCVAFVALAARYYQGNITHENLAELTSDHSDSNNLSKIFRELGNMKTLLPIKIDTDAYDAALDKLFTAFIYNGTDIYSDAKESSSKVTETNFFKDDRNYYKILKRKWRMLKREIHEIFAEI